MGKKQEEAKLPSDKQLGINKTSLYFTKSEYIKRVKVSGDAYLHVFEIETNEGKIYTIGNDRMGDEEWEFEVEQGDKIIAFAGSMQVMVNECRLLNLSVTSKQLFEDCESSAQISTTYRDLIGMRYEMFDPRRTEEWD